MTDGKWTCSSHEENWNGDDEFDTKEDALAYAISEFAPNYGLDDGDSFWIGQISKVTIDGLADTVFDSDDILDRMACWIHDNVGPDFVDDIDWTKEQGEDLERRLAATVREWATANDVEPRCYTLENIERHAWEQCKESKTSTENEKPIEKRCARHIEHDGECDYR